MNKSREDLEQELTELWQEYDNYYEASRDIMQQIDMVKSDLEKLSVEVIDLREDVYSSTESGLL